MTARPLTARLRFPLLALAASGVLAACSGEQGGASKTTGQPSVAAGEPAPAAGQPAGTGGMQGMEGMQGMDGMKGEGMSGMGSGGMMDMHPHMVMMEKAAPDSMKAMLPQHRQMIANMLSQMNAQMRQMNMPTDAEFKAAGDSLRQDLVRMSEMSASELAAAMPAHHGRVKRLRKLHAAMMGDMKGGASTTPKP